MTLGFLRGDDLLAEAELGQDHARFIFGVGLDVARIACAVREEPCAVLGCVDEAHLADVRNAWGEVRASAVLEVHAARDAEDGLDVPLRDQQGVAFGLRDDGADEWREEFAKCEVVLARSTIAMASRRRSVVGLSKSLVGSGFGSGRSLGQGTTRVVLLR